MDLSCRDGPTGLNDMSARGELHANPSAWPRFPPGRAVPPRRRIAATAFFHREPTREHGGCREEDVAALRPEVALPAAQVEEAAEPVVRPSPRGGRFGVFGRLRDWRRGGCDLSHMGKWRGGAVIRHRSNLLPRSCTHSFGPCGTPGTASSRPMTALPSWKWWTSCPISISS